jgi:FkbM family methyltransferase
VSLLDGARCAVSRVTAGLVLFTERPAAIGAALTWARFSLTSFRMVDDLRRQGVLPATVIDVGANVGQFACAVLSLLRPRWVHAFEPFPDAVGALRRTLGTDPRVVVHGVALGADSGELPFHVNAHSHSSSLLRLAGAHRIAFPDATEVAEVKVPVRTLDQELAAVELPGPVLLKLDVQGYERWVLEGARETLRRANWVILEASFRPMYEGEPGFLDLVGDMAERGFRLLRPVGWLVAPATGEILQCDVLFEPAADRVQAGS